MAKIKVFYNVHPLEREANVTSGFTRFGLAFDRNVKFKRIPFNKTVHGILLRNLRRQKMNMEEIIKHKKELMEKYAKMSEGAEKGDYIDARDEKKKLSGYTSDECKADIPKLFLKYPESRRLKKIMDESWKDSEKIREKMTSDAISKGFIPLEVHNGEGLTGIIYPPQFEKVALRLKKYLQSRGYSIVNYGLSTTETKGITLELGMPPNKEIKSYLSKKLEKRAPRFIRSGIWELKDSGWHRFYSPPKLKYIREHKKLLRDVIKFLEKQP